jgi:two-component system response regulator YesN
MQWEVNIVYKVMLVDPNPYSREKMRYILDWNSLGFALDGNAVTPADAKSLFAKHHYSVVLINVCDAHATGMVSCEQIRSKSRVPIILYGGSKDFQMARKALYYQVSDYLPDPVSPEEFITSLQAVKRELDSVAPAENKALSWSMVERQPPPQANIIDKVKEYVRETLNQNITLKEISHILHFNCSYLGQKFKYHESMTFNEYLLQQRMEKAKFLLENTDMRVYEIANEVGYIEMDWFYKKFKAYTGVSANEYRKMISITA